MRRAFAAVLVSIALVIVGALPAQAWDATAYDRYNKDKPAFNLKRAYFGYWPEEAIVRVKVENLSKRKTMVVMKYAPRGRTITVASRHRGGDLVNRAHLNTDRDYRRIRGGIRVRWNFARDVVAFRLDDRWLSRRPAHFLAWTQRKGANHGNHRGDFVYVANLRRGSSPDDASAPFGIEKVGWPGDLEGAKALFDRMPATLNGATLRRHRSFGDSAGVSYGPQGNSTPTAWVMEADRDLPDAPAVLSVMFGLGLACKEGTYRGTAPQSRWSRGPDFDRDGDYPTDDLWWFSCTIDGAEGAPNFTGHALGWASGDLGWLVTTPDRATTRAMARALISAS